jgi:sulfofructose kinase
VDVRGERMVVGYRGTALQAPADWLPLEQTGFAGAMLADVRWPRGADEALRAARDAGLSTVLDAEICERDVLNRLAGIADHVVFSERGLQAWAGPDPESGLRKALERGARVAAVTEGRGGVRWVEADAPDTIRHQPAFAVEVRDTVAAGDVFHGAFTLAIAGERPVADAMRFASAAAAIKCTRTGGRKGAPTREEVERFLKSDA